LGVLCHKAALLAEKFNRTVAEKENLNGEFCTENSG